MSVSDFLDLALNRDHPCSDASPIEHVDVGRDSMIEFLFEDSTTNAGLFLETSSIDEFLKVKPNRAQALTV